MREFLKKFSPGKLVGRPLLKDVATTTLFAVGGRALGLFIPFFIAYWFGASGETDVFFLVYTLILLLSFILGDTIGEVLIPFFSEVRLREGRATPYVGKLLIYGGGFTALVMVFLGLLAKGILPLVVHFSRERLDLLFSILLEMAPMVLILFWTNIFMASLNAAKRFSLPAFSPAIRSVVTLAFIFFFKDSLGIHSVALGYLVGEVVRMAVLFFRATMVEGFSLGKEAFRWDPVIMKVAGTALFRSGARVLGSINTTVDKVMASWLAVGSVSILYYSGRIETVATLLLSAGTMNVVVSYWSERFAREGLERLLKDVKKTALAMGMVAFCVAIVFIALSKPIVALVLGHGAMKPHILELIRWTLVCYLLGFPFKMVNATLVRTYIVLQRTRVLFLQAGLSVFFNVLFNLIFMNILGVAGLALSSSFVAALSLGFWLWSFRYLKQGAIQGAPR